MKITILLNLFIYVETINSIILNNNFDENLVPSYQQWFKPVSKTKMKSRHTKYRQPMQIDMQTSVQQSVVDNSVVKRIDDTAIINKPIYRPRKKYLSPAERGRRIYGQRNYTDRELNKGKPITEKPEQKLVFNTIGTTSGDTDQRLDRPTDIDRAEKCLKDMIATLERLDRRIRKLYKTARNRKLYFFDTLLLTSQRFVNKLINEAHDQTVLLNDNAFRLKLVPLDNQTLSKSQILKSFLNTKIVNELLSNADTLKKKINHSLNELNSLVNDFVKEFKITEDTTDNLLIHSDGTFELTKR